MTLKSLKWFSSLEIFGVLILELIVLQNPARSKKPHTKDIDFKGVLLLKAKMSNNNEKSITEPNEISSATLTAEWAAREPKKTLIPQRKNLSWNTGISSTSQTLTKK